MPDTAFGNVLLGLVDMPVVTNSVSAWPGGLGEQRGKPQHPAVDGGVVDFNAALGEELLAVAVRQRETQVPAHEEDDHLGRKQKPAKAGRAREGGGGELSCHSLPTRASYTAGATVPLRLIALQACSRRRNISALAADSTIEPTRQYRTLVVGPPQLDLDQTRVQQIESVQEALDLRPGAGYKRSGGQLI